MIDIIVCFCDKDYHLIDQFLSYIKKLTFDYQLTLIDNRNDKSIDLHKKLANYNYLIPDRDHGLFESRRYGFNHTKNKFVWFVDIDDEIFNFKFNDSNDDVLIYNFNINNTLEKKIYPQQISNSNRLYSIDINDPKMIGYVNNFLMTGGVWNKLFNRTTLQKCYNSIPYLEGLFTYEDVYLQKHFSYFASKYRTDLQCIYKWNMTNDYKIKDNLPEAERFCSLIVNPQIKKEFRKFLDLTYIQLDSDIPN